MKHVFERWEDGSTTPERIINVKADMEITAYYKEVNGVGKVTFQGSVSAQEKDGETVTIAVTLPDGSPAPNVTTTTKADLTFTLEYLNIPGDYLAKASIEADALYESAESPVVNFSIGKEPRTITLEVVQ